MDLQAIAAPAAIGALRDSVNRDGVAGMPAAFDREWGRRLAEDAATLFAEALSYKGGTVSRGPKRHYFAVHPERIRGFVDLVTHPLVAGLCRDMLGPDYEIAEVGFDVPLPGAVDQPWHRDFEMPPETAATGRLSSLAFNVPTVDVTPEMGPFEYAPGTHRESGEDFAYGMFPDRDRWPAYSAVSRLRCASLGDVSVRTGLCIHRGTANRSSIMRPVLILGMVTPEVETEHAHTLELTHAYLERLPHDVRSCLRCTAVDRLVPMIQRHDIEGLMMGGEAEEDPAA